MNSINETSPENEFSSISYSQFTSVLPITQNSPLVFWLIFCVSLLIFILKTIKHVMKWRINKSDNKREKITHLIGLLSNFVQTVSAHQQERRNSVT